MQSNYLERFDTDLFIGECQKLNWLYMIVLCENTTMLTKATTISIIDPHRVAIDNLRLAFARFTGHLSFILDKGNKAVIPSGMSSENFLKLKPLIARLVSEHELKEDWLELY